MHHAPLTSERSLSEICLGHAHLHNDCIALSIGGASLGEALCTNAVDRSAKFMISMVFLEGT